MTTVLRHNQTTGCVQEAFRFAKMEGLDDDPKSCYSHYSCPILLLINFPWK